MRLAIQTIVTVVRTEAISRYMTALLKLMSMPAISSSIQGSSLNSSWGWNSSLRPSLPKIT